MTAAAALPAIAYPPELPVSAHREQLLEAIGEHQVVVVAGETGSGKTTQLPKLCLELGRERIAHTQPRRLAARTVAARIAEELRVPLGEAVGYAVRFRDRSRADTRIRLMTDGLLLAELRRDKLLRRYDTIIVDEAHERSLNIDFLLGYLRRIQPRRPDLKIVITSATIDPERFSRHFDAPGGRGVGAHLPGRGPLPAGRGPGPRPGGRDRGRVRGAAEGGSRRRARVPVRRARDPRHHRRPERTPPGRRGPAAVRAAVGRRAAEDLPAAPQAAGRAGDERRRDVADGARHPLRGRPRDGADQPLERAAEGPAAADRADLAGVGRPAQGSLRPHRRRDLHPAV